jgi:hypothetical protein
MTVIAQQLEWTVSTGGVYAAQPQQVISAAPGSTVDLPAGPQHSVVGVVAQSGTLPTDAVTINSPGSSVIYGMGPGMDGINSMQLTESFQSVFFMFDGTNFWVIEGGNNIIASDISTGTLETTGNVDIGGTLTVVGTAEFEAGITADETLTVTGVATFNGGIVVNGNMTISDEGETTYITVDSTGLEVTTGNDTDGYLLVGGGGVTVAATKYADYNQGPQLGVYKAFNWINSNGAAQVDNWGYISNTSGWIVCGEYQMRFDDPDHNSYFIADTNVRMLGFWGQKSPQRSYSTDPTDIANTLQAYGLTD